MHDTAYEIGGLFFKHFVGNHSRVLELGSLDVNGSFRDLAPPDAEYMGVDIVPGKSVDVVLDNPHKLPFEAQSFDSIVSSSCFEHDNFFWISFLEMCRVTKQGGFIYINAPSNGAYHTHPIDCWRFYPDSAQALSQWAGDNGISITPIESFIANRKEEPWNDCVMIFKMGEVREYAGPFISNFYPDVYNLNRFPDKSPAKNRAFSQDMAIINEQQLRIAEDDALLKALHGRINEVQVILNAQVPSPSRFKEFFYRLLPPIFSQKLKHRRLSQDIAYLRKSPAFDPIWYLSQYPDVHTAGTDPAGHYVLHGEKEGRQPGPGFNHAHETVLNYHKWESTGCYHVKYQQALKIGDSGFNVEGTSFQESSRTDEEASLDLKNFFQKQILNTGSNSNKINILFIGHEASLTGAPVGFLELIRELAGSYSINPWLVLQSGGPLLDKYKEVAPVLLVPDLNKRTGSFKKSAKDICLHFKQVQGPKLVFANTAAINPLFCRLAKDSGIPYFAWIHEMAHFIEQHLGGKTTMSCLSKNCTSLSFAGQLCYKDNVLRYNLDTSTSKIVEEGVRLVKDELLRDDIRKSVRLELNIPQTAHLVLGCGSIEHRKGTDLFVQIATQYLSNPPAEAADVYFIWVGRIFYPDFTNDLLADIKKSGLEDRIRFIGERSDSHRYFRASDAFLFTSRSDPMALVSIEAIGYKLPIIGFKGVCATEMYIEKGFGIFAPYLDISAMVSGLKQYLLNQITIRDDGDKFVEEHLSVSVVARQFYHEFRSAIFPNHSKRDKTILIVSTGSPPLCGHRAEGGGLRSWGLAKSLKGLLSDFNVTLTYHEHLKGSIKDGYYDEILVKKWNPKNLNLVGEASTVIVSYCSGDLSNAVTALLDPSQQLILDCYVPIYVELCARNSKNVQYEFDSLKREIPTFNQNLKRGDFFLCANEAQVAFYRGVLSALGRINPKTYHNTGLRIVPYGIDSTEPCAGTRPIESLLGDDYRTSRKILWFGAVYPWFNIGKLLEAIRLLNEKQRTCLIVVGARNPFNQHPDFVEAAKKADALFSSSPYSDFVYTHDWVPYEDRADWYLDCDLIITLNEPGIENGLSWRTRLADYVWAGMPVATNGGDPLGEELISCGAAGRLDVTHAESLAGTIAKLLDDESVLKSMKEKMRHYRPKLHWDHVVKPLADVIRTHELAADRF